MEEEKKVFYCKDCDEEVDEDGDTLTDFGCSYCPVYCDTCGDHGCDQSC